MSDILTRLKLDTKDFDAKLGKSKNSTKKWGKQSSSAMQGVTSSLVKMGAAVGLAGVGMKSFNAIIESSQTISDKYAEVQEQATTAVGEFFYSISNGDFSAFNQGLDSMVKKAGEAYRAMDQLGNTMLSFDWAGSENMANITAAQASFQASRSAGDEKGMKASLMKWKAAMEKQSKAVESVKATTWDAISKEVTKSSNLKATDISLDDVIKIRDIDITMPKIREKIKEQYGAIYDEYQNQSKIYADKYRINEGSYIQGGGIGGGGTVVKTGEADPQKQNELAKRYKDAILYNQLLAKYTDDELSTVFTKLKQVDVLSRQLSKQQKTFETSKVQKAIVQPAKKAATTAVKSFISELEDKPINMSATVGMAGISTKGSKLPTKLTKGKTELTPFDKDAIDMNTAYQDSLMGISSVMGSLSGVVKDGAVGWLTWGANLLTAIAAAIPAIGALSVANTAQAATAKEAAVAGGAASVAATPFVGPILAVAAIASILAAFASMPKFATGGIVPGSSFSGDRVPAMVNSGELILNASQQRNLAGQLSGGRNITVGGSFVLRGKDLIASIDKNNRINSRT